MLLVSSGLLDILFVGSSSAFADQADFLATAMWTAAYLIAYHDLNELKGDVKKIDKKLDMNFAIAMHKMHELHDVAIDKMHELHDSALKHSDTNHAVAMKKMQELHHAGLQHTDKLEKNLKNHLDTKFDQFKADLPAMVAAAVNLALDERGVPPPPPPQELSRQVSRS